MHHLVLLISWILPAAAAQQQEVPFKPFSDFEVQFDYKFKQRPVADRYTMDFGETLEERDKKLYSGGQLPYLIVNIKLLALAEGEVRVKAINNLGHTVYTKKAEKDALIKIDMGYTDDVKDRVTPYEFTIYFLSAERKELSRIHMFVADDGSFIVNNEKRGRL